jgi:hypothetical protein
VDSHHLHPRDGCGHGTLFGAFFAISFTIRKEDVTGTLTGHAPSRACRSARLLTQWHRVRWGIGKARGRDWRDCASLPAEPSHGCVVAGQPAVWRLGREQPARADAELLPVGGNAAGDCEGRRSFVRVPNDDLSCQVMTFPVPARLRGNPSPMHPADVPGGVLHRAAALGDRPVHRYMTTASTR